MKRFVFLIGFVLFLLGCNQESYNDAVPSYPVHISINTNVGEFVHFKPDYVNAYMIVDKKGIHFGNQTYPFTDLTQYGYAGTVINVNMMNQYSAFDLCCPNCRQKDQPIVVDGGFADCPICGESFELMNGMGTPSKGISRQSLRSFKTFYVNGIVQVNN